MRISFEVVGIPVAQGSMKVIPVGRRHAMKPSNEGSLAPWRAAVSHAAREAMGDLPPFAGAVSISMGFYFPRPKSHYKTKGGLPTQELKDHAPQWHSIKPDRDKLERAIGDAMTGIVYRDDSQITDGRVFKMYGSPRVTIIVDPLEGT